jgi:Secretion system C-terminal sorting domain
LKYTIIDSKKQTTQLLFEIRTKPDASYTETLLNSFFDACAPISVDEPLPEEEFNIFPNPTDGKFTINLPPAGPEATLVVIDMNGMVVYGVENPHSAVQESGFHLSPGVYFVGLVSKESRQFRKILVR